VDSSGSGSSVSSIPGAPPIFGRTHLKQGISHLKIVLTARYGMFASTGEPSSLQEDLEEKNWRQALGEDMMPCAKTKHGIWFLYNHTKI
jgi:hypothetical protein